jgi:hypothetical protein
VVVSRRLAHLELFDLASTSMSCGRLFSRVLQGHTSNIKRDTVFSFL